MAIYEVPCGDGTDPNCNGLVDLYVDAEDLTDDELQDYMDLNNISAPVCGPCGSDYTRDSDGNIIDD